VGANTEYVRAWIERWNSGDLDALIEDMDPDAEWVVAREHPAATIHRGPEEIGEYFRDWNRTMPGIQIEAVELEELGDRVLAVMRMQAEGAGSGAGAEISVATVTAFRDAKVIRTEEFLDPDEARRALSD